MLKGRMKYLAGLALYWLMCLIGALDEKSGGWDRDVFLFTAGVMTVVWFVCILVWELYFKKRRG